METELFNIVNKYVTSIGWEAADLEDLEGYNEVEWRNGQDRVVLDSEIDKDNWDVSWFLEIIVDGVDMFELWVPPLGDFKPLFKLSKTANKKCITKLAIYGSTTDTKRKAIDEFLKIKDIPLGVHTYSPEFVEGFLESVYGG